jgi:hypothetical protein
MGDHRAGREHDCNVLGSAIPRAPSATDVKPWQPDRLGVGTRDRESRSGHAETPEVSAGRVRPQAPLSDLSRRDQAGRFYRVLAASRTDSRVRGPTTTGFAAHLSLQRGAPRANGVDDCLGFVSLPWPVRPAGVGHTSGCVNFVFARISSAKYMDGFACETVRLLRKARGVTPLAESRFASANHSAHCSGSSAPHRS